MAEYEVNPQAVRWIEQAIDKRQYVLTSEWSDVEPDADAENSYLERHGWKAYGQWHLGLTVGASEETKARYAFVVGDFRRVHRSGLLAARYRATQWDHKEVELAAHELLQHLDRVRSPWKVSETPAGGKGYAHPQDVGPVPRDQRMISPKAA